MNRSIIIYICFAALCIFSCTENKVDVSSLIAERDSIVSENNRQKEELKELNSYVSVIANGLDSIAMQERVLLTSNSGREGAILSKEQIKQNLKLFEELLVRQRKRISALEDSLRSGGGNTANLRNIVNYLNEQLNMKEAEISSLRKELNNKNVDIAKLRSKVSSLNDDVAKLNQKSKIQEEALAVQSDMINECYVKIATKKQLQAEGLLSGGGLFSKAKLNAANMHTDKFTKVDIRTFTEVNINSRNPKILTQMPVSSYTLQENDNGSSTLRIIDPTKFWSISNFLVIQTK